MATIRDIARKAGVSVSTASLALNDDARVRPETRERVMEAVREFDYRPSRSARSLSSGLSYTINLLNPIAGSDLTGGFFARFVQGLHDGAAERGYSVAFSVVSGEQEASTHTDTLISERWTDGLVLLNPSENSALLDLIDRRGFPCVVIGRDPLDRGNSVDNDNYRVGFDTARHLLERGRERLAFINGGRRQTFARDRAEGFRAAAEAAGARAEVLYNDDGVEDAGRLSLEAAAAGATGLAYASDTQAAFGLRALRQAGARVPHDIAMTGMNNDAICEIVDPSLTSVELNAVELGREAAALVLERIADPGLPPQRRLVPHSLVARNST